MSNLSSHARVSWLSATLVIVLSGVGRGQSATCTSPGFIAADEYPTTSGIFPIVTAEMTDDTFPDLVGTGGNSIVVLPGLPDASFGPPIVTSLADSAQLFTTGDFSGDGKTDVAAAFTFGGIQLLVGNGDGTLQSPIPLIPIVSPTVLTSADVDGDGLVDLVTTSGSLLRVYLNEGLGTFSGPYQTPVWRAAPIVLGDLNGDGSLDAVGSRPPLGGEVGQVVFYPGRGDGTFEPSLTVSSEGDPTSIQVADLTGDGLLDVAAASGFDVQVSVGHGDGTFEPAVNTSAPVIKTIQAADLDGDGRADLLASKTDEFNGVSGALQVLMSNGDGSLRPDLTYATGFGFYSFVAGRFGNNVRTDIAVAGDAPVVRVMRGNGDGTLRAPTMLSFGTPILALTTGDLNEDGFPDLAYVFSFSGGTVISFSFGGPRARFSGGGTISLGGALAGLATADLDGDGHLDLATLNANADVMTALLGHGDGTFTVVSNTPVPSVTSFSTLLLVNLDGDGIPDAVTLDRDLDRRSDQIGIFLGNGDGTFRLQPPVSIPLPANGITAADLDGDAIADLAVTGVEPGGSFPGRLFLLPGLGNGAFGTPVTFPTGISPGPVRAADLDEDGHVDLAVGHTSDAPLLVFPGNGDGTFQKPYGIGTGGSVSDLVIADFQGDGHVDLLTSGGGRVHLLYGIGDGTFEFPLSYIGGTSTTLAAADFDGNGTLDTAVGDAFSLRGGIELLLSAAVAVQIPAQVVAAPGDEISLIAMGSGLGFVGYQWRKGGVPLTDGGSISGATTPTLTIDPVSFADAGSYDVEVTDDCGSVTSNAASLSVEFADVPVSSPFHDDILAIATAGITSGCGGGNYCPTSPVRRDQMAVFLLKAEHGSLYTPPACAGVFADVPCPSAFADWIEQLAAEGVTGGCGGGNYCPGASVTRAQMAVFLLKTSQGSGYTPPAATGIFGDVPVGSFAADFIEDLYTRGITGGCQTSPLLYCPSNAVLRQQMATLIVRTFFP